MSKDFTYMHALFSLIRNVMNYHNLRGCRLHISHVSVIYRYAMHSCIIFMHCTMHVFAQSYLTLPYVTSLQDSFCLGIFTLGFILLPPCSLASSQGCSLAIVKEFVWCVYLASFGRKFISWAEHQLVKDLRCSGILLFLGQDWACKVSEFSVWLGYLMKWELNLFVISRDHLEFFNLFEEENSYYSLLFPVLNQLTFQLSLPSLLFVF